MCFENLPIEFDENGKAHLKEGVKNPYTYATQTVEERDQVLADIAKKNGQLPGIPEFYVQRAGAAEQKWPRLV